MKSELHPNYLKYWSESSLKYPNRNQNSFMWISFGLTIIRTKLKNWRRLKTNTATHLFSFNHHPFIITIIAGQCLLNVTSSLAQGRPEAHLRQDTQLKIAKWPLAYPQTGTTSTYHCWHNFKIVSKPPQEMQDSRTYVLLNILSSLSSSLI